ncbi:flagellar basal body-associated protein FliL [Alteromonas gilva]|uniref:Flagellar protein FliL n=1 Tax=Alteromonas gilva TaxID=2987522 RepID=A0ABT5L269_9ALTE|nr:flagellar basal body-associated protein FliL [Alteromonas gilva]MDC8830496.1 flagellar basal body-associated protein FliL [Alteromonas gilva]
MAEEELQIEEGGKKSKLMLIIIIAVVLIGGGGAAYFFLFAGSDQPSAAEELAAESPGEMASTPSSSADVGTALYVAMPRPIVFNVPGSGRDRLVQIKVQLMVRGTDNEEMAQTHIPLIEGTLLQAFSASNADNLVTEVGKIELRENALEAVQTELEKVAGAKVVERVLFTDFVMQ